MNEIESPDTLYHSISPRARICTMLTLHPYYHHLLSNHLERLVSPHFDEDAWQERLDYHRRLIDTKERIWLRAPGEFRAQCEPYLNQLELLLELTLPALKQMMRYREEEERRDYTRLTEYRAALLAEQDRVLETLDRLDTYPETHARGANDDIEIGRHTTDCGEPLR